MAYLNDGSGTPLCMGLQGDMAFIGKVLEFIFLIWNGEYEKEIDDQSE